MIKLGNATQDAIREAIDKKEGEYGQAFRAKFKSITFDNGVEFLQYFVKNGYIFDKINV